MEFLLRVTSEVPEIAPLVSEEKSRRQVDPSESALLFSITRMLLDPAWRPLGSEWKEDPETVNRFFSVIEEILEIGIEDDDNAIESMVGWIMWDIQSRQTADVFMGPCLARHIEALMSKDSSLLTTALPFLRHVADEVPNARTVIERGLDFWNGEIYSTFILSALSDYALSVHRRCTFTRHEDGREVMAKWLMVVEEGMRNKQIKELLRQTFIEDLVHSDLFESLAPMLGGNVLREVEHWRTQ